MIQQKQLLTSVTFALQSLVQPVITFHACLASMLLLLALPTTAWTVPPSLSYDVPTPVLPAFSQLPAKWAPLGGNIPTVAHGTLHVLVILIGYSDIGPSDPLTTDPAYFEDLFFGNDAVGEGPYPYKSLRQYYFEQSFGKLELSGSVVGWLEAPQPNTYYATKNGADFDGTNGLGAPFGNVDAALRGGANALVGEAINLAITEAGIAIDGFDGNNDGVLDAVLVVHPGPGAENTGGLGGLPDHDNHLWSHQLEAEFTFPDDTTRSVRYLVASEQFYWPITKQLCPVGIGVIAHEFGHVLGLPDLNDPPDGFGVGYFSLMGWGLYNNKMAEDPVFCPDVEPMGIDPWLAVELGWVTPITLTENNCSLSMNNFSTSGDVYEISLAGGNERYLFAAMPSTGFHAQLGAPGVLIFHEDMVSGPAFKSLNQMGINCDPSDGQAQDCIINHYWLSVEQADGNFDLENERNSGEARDLWQAGDDFSATGTPSSCAWDTADCRVNLGIKTVTQDGATIRVVVDPNVLPPAPQLKNLPPTTAVVDEIYQFQPLLATGEDVVWTLAQQPDGMTIDAATGLLTWTPTSTGFASVRLVASNCSGEDSRSWTIEVQETFNGGCQIDATKQASWQWLVLMMGCLAGLYFILRKQLRVLV